MPTPFTLKHVNQVSILDTARRQFNPLDLSFPHALWILIGGIFIILNTMPSLNIDEWMKPGGYFFSTPYELRVLYTVSCVYFLIDTIMIFVNAKKKNNGVMKLDVLDYGYLFHHVVCLAANWGPVINGKDGVMITLAYIIGEISNPPRGLADMVQAEIAQMKEICTNFTKDSKTSNVTEKEIRACYATMIANEYILVEAHWYLFAIFRIVGSLYMWFGTRPYCETITTDVTGWLITIFSTGSVVFLIFDRQAKAKQYHIHCDPFSGRTE